MGVWEELPINDSLFFLTTKVTTLRLPYDGTILYYVNYLKQNYILNGKNKTRISKMKEMVSFTCQADWVTGCPGVWLNVILGASEGLFLDAIHISLMY